MIPPPGDENPFDYTGSFPPGYPAGVGGNFVAWSMFQALVNQAVPSVTADMGVLATAGTVTV